jgi:hypothetical protein
MFAQNYVFVMALFSLAYVRDYVSPTVVIFAEGIGLTLLALAAAYTMRLREGIAERKQEEQEKSELTLK